MGAGTTGALVGLGLAVTERVKAISERARNARRDARDAGEMAEDALQGVQDLADQGAILRSSQARMADLEVGICYPESSTPPSPSAYATTPQPQIRPTFTETDAGDFAAYPGRENEYDSKGQLTQPDEAFAKGQNVGTGMALGFVEARAALMGLQIKTASGLNPASAAVVAIYRFFQSLVTVLASFVTSTTPDGMSQSSMTTAITEMLLGIGFRRLARWVGPALVTGASSEMILTTVRLPAGSAIQDDELNLSLVGAQVGVNAADTTTIRVRLGGLSGLVLFDSGAQAIAASAGIKLDLRAVVLNASTSLALLGFIGDLSVNGLSSVVKTVSQSVALGTDQDLVVTVQHSTNNAANQTQGVFASLCRVR